MTVGANGGTSGGRRRVPPATLDIEQFNALDHPAASEVLSACLDIPEWIDAVVAGRPHRQRADLLAAGAAAFADVTWPQVAGALDRHPRIGEQRAAQPGSATEAAWSTAEQAGVADSHAQALARGNADYERKFGHIFLICAGGLSGDQILSALHARLAHHPAQERGVVMDELGKIAQLRLAKAVAP